MGADVGGAQVSDSRLLSLRLLSRLRELLQRDEAILQQLLQQEIKKKESLKAAEGKVTKLREQLLASERIVGANKTLLRKLQEQVFWRPLCPRGPFHICTSCWSRATCVTLQVQRVEHRVTVKKSLAARFEQELSHAQLVANRAAKRKINSGQMLVRSTKEIILIPLCLVVTSDEEGGASRLHVHVLCMGELPGVLVCVSGADCFCLLGHEKASCGKPQI